VLQSTGSLACRLQNEGVRAGHAVFQQPELPSIQACEAPYFIQAGAHQSEMMVSIGPPDAPHALEGILVVDVAPEGVAGVRRVGDDAPAPHDLGSTADCPPLGIDGVKGEILRCRSMRGHKYQLTAASAGF